MVVVARVEISTDSRRSSRSKARAAVLLKQGSEINMAVPYQLIGGYITVFLYLIID